MLEKLWIPILEIKKKIFKRLLNLIVCGFNVAGRKALDGVPFWGVNVVPPGIPRSGGYYTPSP